MYLESERQRRQHKFRLKADSMSQINMANELQATLISNHRPQPAVDWSNHQVPVLSQELDTLKPASLQAAESLRDEDPESTKLQNELQRRERAIQDATAVKGAQYDLGSQGQGSRSAGFKSVLTLMDSLFRIKDLKDQLHTLQLSKKKEEEAFQRNAQGSPWLHAQKSLLAGTGTIWDAGIRTNVLLHRRHDELDPGAWEKNVPLVLVEDADMEQLPRMEARILELEAQCQVWGQQLRRVKCKQKVMVKEKDALIYKLHEENATLQLSMDTLMAQLMQEVVPRDLQLKAMQEQEANFKAQLAGKQQDVDRYRHQLAQSMNREQNLQQARVQVDLKWQRRCDDLKTELHRWTENLVQDMTSALQQEAARLQVVERLLCEREAEVKAVSLERYKLVEALRSQSCTSLLEEKDDRQYLSRPSLQDQSSDRNHSGNSLRSSCMSTFQENDYRRSRDNSDGNS